MNSALFQTKYQTIKQAVTRGVLVCCLATTLAVSFGFVHEVKSVSAAPVAARQDRRPDRERSVGTSTTTEGFSSSSSSQQARPRMIRR